MQVRTLCHAASYCNARLNVIKRAVMYASLYVLSRRTDTSSVLHALRAYVFSQSLCFSHCSNGGRVNLYYILTVYYLTHVKLSYGREIRGLLWKEVDSEDRSRDVRSCQPTPGEEGGANLDKSSRRSAL